MGHGVLDSFSAKNNAGWTVSATNYADHGSKERGHPARIVVGVKRRVGFGGEAATARYFLNNEMREGGEPFDVAAGDGSSRPGEMTWAMAELFFLYQHDHMLLMDAERWYGLQAHARGGRLGTVFAPTVPTYEEMGWIRFVHNPIGRILFAIAAPTMAKMMARVGFTIDRVSAARVVVSARALHAESGVWPASEADLVPNLLASWPTSALNGEPLPWDPRGRELRLLGRDGRTPCEEVECIVTY